MTASQTQFLDETKSLACIHCGLCLGSCPTYLETGNENESPRGRIYLMRAMQAGRIPLESDSVRHIDLCLGCRACEAACPSGVQYGTLLEETRDFIESHHRRSRWQTFLRRVAIERVFPFPNRMKRALLPARLARALRLDRVLPRRLREPFDLLPDKLTEAHIPELMPATAQPARGRVGFIRGCVMNIMFGETNLATIRLLNRMGYDVITPANQVCCGALYAHSGRLDSARDLARRNITEFERHQLDSIIINAAGCGSTLKEYGHLLEHDASWAQRGAAFSNKVRDITEFLSPFFVGAGNVSNGTQEPPRFKPCPERVTYHDACHLAHPQRITKPPRDLVKAVAGSNYVELLESDVCCGSAGSYNLTEPDMAARLQTRKTQNILKTGARIVVTTNPGCILQIRAGLRKAAAPQIRVLHIADFLYSALRGPPPA